MKAAALPLASASARGHLHQAVLAALAFMVACVAHEAIGHGGMCIALGGRVALLSSVYFRCSPGHPLVDAAGPAMNLFVGVACWGLLSAQVMRAFAWRSFVALVMAFNLFWGTGYFVYSAASDGGDWAFALRDLALQPAWAWSLAMGALGACLYYGSLRLVGAWLPRGVSGVTAWLAGGLTSCLAVLFFRGAVLPALSQAAWESFGAAVGLLLLARRAPSRQPPGATAAATGSDHRWLLAAVVALGAFTVTLGRGLP